MVPNHGYALNCRDDSQSRIRVRTADALAWSRPATLTDARGSRNGSDRAPLPWRRSSPSRQPTLPARRTTQGLS